MRTFLLLLGTVVVIGLFAGAYVWLQPATPQAVVRIPKSIANQQVAPPTSNESKNPLQKGTDVFFTVPDEKTNRTAWQFRASRYEPQPDNSVHVTNPEAVFFFDDGQIVTLQGTTGRMVIPGSASKGADMRTPSAPPSRGELYDVIISMFNSDNRDHPTMVCNVNNVSFDNDTFRIATEAYKEADGTLVPADQVPVQVRGDDQDFDGRGLTILWNDRDRRLQLLEIAHGESLTLKSANMMEGFSGASGSPTTKPAARVAATPAAPVPARGNGARGGAARGNAARGITARGTPNRSGQPARRGGAPRPNRGSAAQTPPRRVAPPVLPAAGPTTKRATTQPVYHATFLGGADGVTVMRGEEVIAEADTLSIDSKQQEQTAGPTTAPAAESTAARSPSSRPRTARATTARSAPAAVAQAPTAPGANPEAPNAQPADTEPSEPLVIYWSGTLRVIPLPEATAPKLNPGDRNIEMTSTGVNPVVLHNAGGGDSGGVQKEIRCASFLYSSADQGLIVRSSTQFPLVTMTDSDGASFYTPSLVYRGQDKLAILEGASHAVVPIMDDQNQPAGVMNASWTKLCVLTLAGGADEHAQPDSIKQARMSGDVKIDHPKIKLNSDQLQIEFEPPAEQTPDPANKEQASPQIKELVASGSVKCDMLDEQQGARHITSDQLHLITAKSTAGQLVAKEMNATGNVHSFDASQDLRANRLKVTLGATTRPTDQPKVENLLAQDQVTFTFKDGSGTCGTLEARADGDDYNVSLTGAPLATVVSGESTISGPIIKMQPKRGTINVVGPGTLHGLAKRDTSDAKPSPFDAKWESELMVDGATNHAEINKNVLVTTISASDGSVNNITGDKVLMELMDDPTATTKPAATRPVTTRPGPPDTEFADAFGGLRSKTVRTITVEGNTKMESTLNDATGYLLRRLYVAAPQIRMESETKRFVIPSAGVMLFEERAPATQPSTQPTSQVSIAPATGPSTAPSDSPFGSMKGPTAFQWDKELTFDENLNRAEMIGNVQISHEERQSPQHFDLLADRVITNFEKNQPATQPSAAPASEKKSKESDFKLKMLVAEGNVKFSSKQIEFLSPQMSYNPETETLFAQGDDSMLVQMFEPGAAPRGSFKTASWNTKTWQVTVENAVGQFAR